MTDPCYSLVEFNSLSEEQRSAFFDFCKLASLENLPAARNMWNDNWKDTPGSLPNVLLLTDRFKTRGAFHILFCDKEIVLCGGVYLSEFSKKIALAGTRTWVNKPFRHLSLVRDYLLPAHKKWAISVGCKQIAICFNEYNKSLKRIFFRNRLGETNSRLFFRTEDHLFFSNINELPFTVNIQNTPQWVLYEKIDPNWEFDWLSLKTDVYSTY